MANIIINQDKYINSTDKNEIIASLILQYGLPKHLFIIESLVLLVKHRSIFFLSLFFINIIVYCAVDRLKLISITTLFSFM